MRVNVERKHCRRHACSKLSVKREEYVATGPCSDRRVLYMYSVVACPGLEISIRTVLLASAPARSQSITSHIQSLIGFVYKLSGMHHQWVPSKLSAYLHVIRMPCYVKTSMPRLGCGTQEQLLFL